MTYSPSVVSLRGNGQSPFYSSPHDAVSSPPFWAPVMGTPHGLTGTPGGRTGRFGGGGPEVPQHIFQGHQHLCQLGAFLGVGAIVTSFVPAWCPVGRGGVVGYIRKTLEKGYLEHPGSACCTDGMFKIFVLFRRRLCCLLPLFVNRQPPCPHTNSRHVLLHPQMHHRNLWFAKEHALVGKTGCVLLVGRRLAKQKGLVQPVRSNLHAITRNTRF